MTERTSIGDELIESLGQAVAHVRGEKVDARVSKVAPAVQVKTVRKKLGLSQSEFARLVGTSVSGLRKWEQAKRQPRGAALTLLRVMDENPCAVLATFPDIHAQSSKRRRNGDRQKGQG